MQLLRLSTRVWGALPKIVMSCQLTNYWKIQDDIWLPNEIISFYHNLYVATSKR